MNNMAIKSPKKIDSISKLDSLLSSDEVFFQNFSKDKVRLKKLIFESVLYHIKNNKYYANYCDKLNFSLSTNNFDLEKVPLLPSAIFKKDLKLVQSNIDDSVLITTSSGTQGTVSKVPRDNNTLMRFFASVAAGVQEIFDIKQSEVDLFCLTPPFEEVEHLWISYVVTGVSVYFPSKFYILNDKFLVEKFISDLRQIKKRLENKIIIVGPPALIFDTTKVLESTERLNLGDNCTIVTIGGWKSRKGEMVSRNSFDSRVTQAFGLTSEESVRDVYNMVELNTVIFECRKHRKHCPPWLFSRTRHPKNLNIQPSGKSGILAFLDSTPTSYPGFILSDDFGMVHENVNCSCGITSDIIEIERRVNKIESRGCALKI